MTDNKVCSIGRVRRRAPRAARRAPRRRRCTAPSRRRCFAPRSPSDGRCADRCIADAAAPARRCAARALARRSRRSHAFSIGAFCENRCGSHVVWSAHVRLAWSLRAVRRRAATTTDDRPLELEYVTKRSWRRPAARRSATRRSRRARRRVRHGRRACRRVARPQRPDRVRQLQYDPPTPPTRDLIIWIAETDPFGLGHRPHAVRRADAERRREASSRSASARRTGRAVQPGRERRQSLHADASARHRHTCTEDWNFAPVDGCAPATASRRSLP